MPRFAEFTADTPVNVEAATRVFGAPLRVQVLRHFLLNPGASQRDAVAALGSAQRSVASNIVILVDAGVLLAVPSETDKRSTAFTVDTARLDELKTALDDFLSL